MLSFYKATSALGCGLRQPPPRAAFDSRAATETGRAPPAVGVGGTRRPPLLTSNSVSLSPRRPPSQSPGREIQPAGNLLLSIVQNTKRAGDGASFAGDLPL